MGTSGEHRDLTPCAPPTLAGDTRVVLVHQNNTLENAFNLVCHHQQKMQEISIVWIFCLLVRHFDSLSLGLCAKDHSIEKCHKPKRHSIGIEWKQCPRFCANAVKLYSKRTPRRCLDSRHHVIRVKGDVA